MQSRDRRADEMAQSRLERRRCGGEATQSRQRSREAGEACRAVQQGVGEVRPAGEARRGDAVEGQAS